MMRWWKALALVALVAPLSVAWTAPAGRPPIRLPEVVIIGLPVAEPTEAKEPVRLPRAGPLKERPPEVKEPVDVASLQEAGRTRPVAPAPGCAYRGGVTTVVAKVFLHDEAQYKLGLYRIQHGQHTEAVQAFQDLLARYPKSPWRTAAHYWIGEAHLDQGDEDRALAAYEAAGGEAPRQHLADYGLYATAWLLVRRGQDAQAVEKLAQLIEQFPSSPVLAAALELKSTAHWKLGQFAQAAAASRQLAFTFPDDRRAPEARFWQAEGAYRAGAFREADEAYRAFLARYPDHPRSAEALYGLGWTGLAREDVHKALETFLRFEETYPDHRLLASARYGQVRSALAVDQPGLARQRLAVLQETAPGQWATAALAAVADAAFRAGRAEEALASSR
ncbi:MAG: tol-pal system YbgF family protein, partial [Nitrospinota bacterium]